MCGGYRRVSGLGVEVMWSLPYSDLQKCFLVLENTNKCH